MTPVTEKPENLSSPAKENLAALAEISEREVIRQNRMSQLAQHRAHLDLQINLLTEQKVTKILRVIDDIRRDSNCLLFTVKVTNSTRRRCWR